MLFILYKLTNLSISCLQPLKKTIINNKKRPQKGEYDEKNIHNNKRYSFTQQLYPS